jgi:hypothetical protein
MPVERDQESAGGDRPPGTTRSNGVDDRLPAEPSRVASAGAREPRSESAAVSQSSTHGARHGKEIGGPKGPEPTRYGDWERAGRCIDF